MYKSRFYILALCVFFPPIAYILTLQIAETHLGQRYHKDIKKVFLGDTHLLLTGGSDIREVIQRQIESYLANDLMAKMGTDVQVTVVTRQNTLLFPLVANLDVDRGLQQNPMTLAAENYKLMNEGILLKVGVKIPHNALLARCFLILYIFLDMTALGFYFLKTEKFRAEQQGKIKELEKLRIQEEAYRRRLKDLAGERKSQILELEATKKNLEKEKELAVSNEEELFNDVVLLEKELEMQTAVQERQDVEICRLKEMIEGLQAEQQKLHYRKRGKTSGERKRFATLYKNISLNDRAFEGINALSDEMKIKCEEVIQQLDSEPSQVPIKRKVFGPKGREAVFELAFAYKGRLYYRNLANRRVEILCVGTKNTQGKDLEFLNRI